MNIVFTIQIFALADKIRPNFFGPPGFPLDLEEVSSDWGCYQKYFSSRKKALAFIKKNIKPQDKEEIEAFDRIINIRITSSLIDSNKFVNYEILDKNFKTLIDGSKMDKPFNGAPSKYSIGDWVMFFEGSRVHCGIIGAVGYTKEEIKQEKLKNLTVGDNLYYILWDNFRNPKDEFAHSHLHENLILQKVPSDEDGLRTYLTSHTIGKLERQFKEYIEYQEKRKQSKGLK